MILSFSIVQELSFFAVFVTSMLVLLYTCGKWIINDIRSNRTDHEYSPDAKNEFDKYFTSKGYLVWDIMQDEVTKKWKVSLVKNEKIIEAKGFSINEIEKYAETFI
jgi:hypothetical protein